jgi:hypothetical protein
LRFSLLVALLAGHLYQRTAVQVCLELDWVDRIRTAVVHAVPYLDRRHLSRFCSFVEMIDYFVVLRNLNGSNERYAVVPVRAQVVIYPSDPCLPSAFQCRPLGGHYASLVLDTR